MHRAQCWKSLTDGRIQCRLCAHCCILQEGATGRCAVRKHEQGTLYTLAEYRIAALNTDPIEKKPLYHFLPGTATLSVATMGCNFSCAWCQNHELWSPLQQRPLTGERVSPKRLVDLAHKTAAQSMAFTYSEPTVFFELMQETARLARQKGLKNILVSNGFQSKECLEALRPLIHAANIDLKAFSDRTYRHFCKARLQPVLDTLRAIRQMGWWLELTTLIVPGVNDSPEELCALAQFIAQELGPDTPWHISRFRPAYTMTNSAPTPVETINKALEIAHKAGLHFVYAGNTGQNNTTTTLCPHCNTPVLNRAGYTIQKNTLVQGACPSCKKTVAGVWDGKGLS